MREHLCSNLIPTCIDNGVAMERILGLVDDMHSAGYVALQDTYIRLILALAKQVNLSRSMPAITLKISEQPL